MNSIIYRATNTINGKAYIGFDSAWPRRKHQHIGLALNPNHPQYNSSFHKALRKYGIETFYWEVLYRSENPSHTLKVMEEKFIRECNSHYLDGHGYNMTYGGNGHFGPRSEKTKKKISIAHLGVPLSESHILAKSKDFIVTDPNGKELSIRNLSKFCRNNKLSQGAMSMVAKGLWKQHKGWNCRVTL